MVCTLGASVVMVSMTHSRSVSKPTLTSMPEKALSKDISGSKVCEKSGTSTAQSTKAEGYEPCLEELEFTVGDPIRDYDWTLECW